MATLQERRLGYPSRAGLEPGTSRFSTLRINHCAARGILSRTLIAPLHCMRLLAYMCVCMCKEAALSAFLDLNLLFCVVTLPPHSTACFAHARPQEWARDKALRAMFIFEADWQALLALYER
jgi:hypothetical protein